MDSGGVVPEETEVTTPPGPGITHPDPSLSGDQIVAAIEAAFATGIPEPLLPRDSYLSFFEHADGACPTGVGTSLPGDFEGCSTEDGTFFFGHSEYDQGVEGYEAGFYLLGDFYMLDVDGNRFDGGGEILVQVWHEDATLRWTSMVLGTWSYPPAGDWMAEGDSTAMWQLGKVNGNNRAVALEGSWQAPGANLSFKTFLFDEGVCHGAPTGELTLREDTGYRYVLTFASPCDGCASVVYADDTDMGSVCIDFGGATQKISDSMLADLGQG